MHEALLRLWHGRVIFVDGHSGPHAVALMHLGDLTLKGDACVYTGRVKNIF